jgi:hypothetical protein
VVSSSSYMHALVDDIVNTNSVYPMHPKNTKQYVSNYIIIYVEHPQVRCNILHKKSKITFENWEQISRERFQRRSAQLLHTSGNLDSGGCYVLLFLLVSRIAICIFIALF